MEKIKQPSVIYLLIIFAHCTFAVSVLEFPALSDLRAYDIVEPIVVSKSGKHHRWRRAVQKHVNGEDLEFILHTKLKKYHLFLQLNRRLIHPDFTLTYQTRNGKNKVEKPILENCHYHGRLSETNSRAAISICEGGLSGRIITSTGENVFIEPLNDKHGRHIVFKSKDVKSNKSTKIDMLSRMVPRKLENNIRFRRNIDGNLLVNQTKYITIAFVADKAYYTSQGGMEKSITKIMKIINHMDFIYRTINVRIAIISLDIWNIRNVITITNVTSSNLNIFNKYNLAELVINRQGKHDNAQLLTGIDQEGSLVGLAAVGTMCTDSSSAFVQDIGNAGVTASTIAHELGHNLGFIHNSWWCVCPVTPCVMNSYVSWTPANGFTDCTRNKFDDTTANGKYQCLFDVPKKLYGDPVCGNGFLEEGEFCDCGTVEECKDSCCNATSCMLLGDAECSSGRCCENCRFKPRGSLCRNLMSECDLEEYCTGSSHLYMISTRFGKKQLKREPKISTNEE